MACLVQGLCITTEDVTFMMEFTIVHARLDCVCDDSEVATTGHDWHSDQHTLRKHLATHHRATHIFIRHEARQPCCWESYYYTW